MTLVKDLMENDILSNIMSNRTKLILNISSKAYIVKSQLNKDLDIFFYKTAIKYTS